MKIIFLKDVPRVGRKYDIKNVPDGYARNFLLPRGFAEIATDKNTAKIEEKRKAEEETRRVQTDLLVKNINDLSGATVRISGKANEKGHLFAGLHKEELAKVIKEETGLDIEPEFILLDKPIRETGEHDIFVSGQGMKAKFKIVVSPN